MWELLGLDKDSQARGEKGSLNNRRTEFETWDLGDRFRSAVTGVSREDLEKASKILADSDLQDEFGKKIEVLTSNLSGRGLNPTGMGFDGQTREDIKGDIQTNQNRLTALTQLLGQKGGDSVELDPDASAMDIVTAGRTLADTNTEIEEGKKTAETRRLEGRDDDRLAMTMELSRLDRKDEREARRDERAYQNRKLDMQEARLDRKDRQAAIQQMMAGLAQMGASIAI